jgi:F-type H+-transporting ATPase subunit alpha
MAAFAQFSSDLDISTQNLLNRGSRLTELLKQDQYAPLSTAEQVALIFAGVEGYLDDVPVKSIGQFEKDFLDHLRIKEKQLLQTIYLEKELSPALKKEIKTVLENFKKHHNYG